MMGNSLLDQRVQEEFTKDEQTILLYFFSNIDKPVFTLKNMDQGVAGALFARYSRTHKSLRRLFLDEFVVSTKEQDPKLAYEAIAEEIRSGRYESLDIGNQKAGELYKRLAEFGDDSVNQLGGAHLAVERCSNILTKVIEWGRLSAYLEQSTRFIKYDEKGLDGEYRYMVPQELDDYSSSLGEHFRKEMNRLFDIYSECTAALVDFYKAKFTFESEEAKLKAKDPDAKLSQFVYSTSIRTQACDKSRALLPAATVSNLGWFAPGQQFEIAIERMRSSPLQEMRDFADLALEELNTVIPEFLKRTDEEGKGLAYTEYLREREEILRETAAEMLRGVERKDSPRVKLVDFTELSRAEEEIIAGALYRHSNLPLTQLRRIARKMSVEEKIRLLKAAAGTRQNRRHKPGREFENVSVEFDVLGDYGSFRDLQRHRILTIEWQELSATFDYEINPVWEEAGLKDKFVEGMELSRDLYNMIARQINPTVAQYAVAFGYPLRYRMRFNLREAFHMFELRTSPQAHPSYKSIILEMVDQLINVAGYDRLMALLIFLGQPQEEFLTRIDALDRTEKKLQKSN